MSADETTDIDTLVTDEVPKPEFADSFERSELEALIAAKTESNDQRQLSISALVLANSMGTGFPPLHGSRSAASVS